MIPEVASRGSSLGARFVALGGLAITCVATLTPGTDSDSVSGVCLICGELGGVDAVLNVLLFVPFGLGLGLMKVRWWRGMAVCMLVTLIIESLQFAAVAGRDASVGDVVTNSLGGALGLALGWHWRVLSMPSDGMRKALVAGAVAAWTTVCGLTAFTLQPRPTDPPFYGQLARQRSDDPPYPGVVNDAMVGGIHIPDEKVPEGPGIPEALRSGAPFAIRIIPRAVPSWFSPIARIADRHDVENAVIAAEGSDAMFRVRTNASFLRLRPYTIGVSSALQSTGRPVSIAGSFHDAKGRLVIVSEAGTREANVVFGLGSGWRLILPFGSVAGGSTPERFLDVVWLSLLALPVAYWCTLRARGWLLAATGVGAGGVLVGVMLLIDHAFQGPVVMTDIAGVFAGIAAGSLLSRAVWRISGYQPRRGAMPRTRVT